MMRHPLIFALALCLPLAGYAQEEPDPTVEFADTDPAMNAAIATAQDTLGLFLENGLDADGLGLPGAYVKARIPVKEADFTHENIWIGPFGIFPDGSFVGLLANEPVGMPGFHRGDRIEFTRDMIVDWSLQTENGQTYGDFTTRVIVDQMPAEDAAALAGRFIEPAVPAEWNK